MATMASESIWCTAELSSEHDFVRKMFWGILVRDVKGKAEKSIDPTTLEMATGNSVRPVYAQQTSIGRSANKYAFARGALAPSAVPCMLPPLPRTCPLSVLSPVQQGRRRRRHCERGFGTSTSTRTVHHSLTDENEI